MNSQVVKNVMNSQVVILLAVVLFPSSAYAYIGPGMGAGALASVIGIISSLILVIFAILYYPIKRFIKKRKSSASTPLEAEEQKQTDGK